MSSAQIASSPSAPPTTVELRSTIDASGKLVVSLAEVPLPPPREGEVVVRVEAAPLNPSDMGALLGPVDVKTLRAAEEGGRPAMHGDVPAARLEAVRRRVEESLVLGHEGAGVVVGAGPGAEGLLGRVIATRTVGMFAQHRVARVADCLLMPEGVEPRDAASAFINPLTVLGMVETMRHEGHSALVHTAAGSNVGQMLRRLCAAERIPLVNVVRSAESAGALQAAGARYVVDSSQPTFREALEEAVAATGATLAFDAIGGGKMPAQLLDAMEKAALRETKGFLRYGTPVHKQVYVYGALDPRPTELARSFGMAWGIGGWLLTWWWPRQEPARQAALKERVAREIRTTFATTYGGTIGLADLTSPTVIAGAARRATGAKLLVCPRHVA